MEAKYLNRSRNGLKNGHIYTVYFTKPLAKYAYECHIVYDNTAEEEVDIHLNYSSEISIKNNFDVKVLRLEDN